MTDNGHDMSFPKGPIYKTIQQPRSGDATRKHNVGTVHFAKPSDVRRRREYKIENHLK